MNSLQDAAARAGATATARAASPGALCRRDLLLCALLCAAWFGLTAGLRPLAIPDEGRYVGVAWEMLRSGDWSVPTLNGAPFFHKPPLFYWLTATAMTVFGPGAWAARTASVLSATLVATLLFGFASRWRDVRTGWTVVLVLATTPLFYGSSQYANLDPLVAACIAATILCGADSVLRDEGSRPRGMALAFSFVAAACGVLAKGLIGVVLPAAVLLCWALATGRLARVVRAFGWLPGWGLFLAIAAPWFVAMQWRFAEFSHYFFVVQHLDRFTTAGFNNSQPFWFYPALLALGMAPWSPWWALAVARGRRARRPDPHGLGALMLAWAAVVTTFFSWPQSKPIGYILPALPPLAWWVADAVASAGPWRLRDRRFFATAGPWRLRDRRFFATAGIAAVVCVGAALVEHFQQPKSQALLASQLQARRLPDEPVAFIGNYWFDIPFYASLDAPVFVVDDWSSAEVAKDSWRRELVDAERFGGDGTRSRLIHPDELKAALGAERSAWVVGPSAALRTDPWLAAQTLVFEREGTALWHVVPERLSGAPALPPAP